MSAVLTLNRGKEAANSAENLSTFYAQVHRIIGELMYAKSFYILLREDTANQLRVAYWQDASGTPTPTATPLEDGPYPALIVAREGRVLHLSRAQLRRKLRAGELIGYGTLCEDWVGVPLKIEQRVVGALIVQSYDKKCALLGGRGPA